jgi:hypothetical protein
MDLIQIAFRVSSIPDKYSHINFKPPKGVSEAAKKGLEYRKKAGGKGGTEVGVARARDLKNGSNISPETIRRIHNFFSRHEKNKSINPDHKSEPWKDKGYTAWLLWGGNPGRSWVNKIMKQMESADNK